MLGMYGILFKATYLKRQHIHDDLDYGILFKLFLAVERPVDRGGTTAGGLHPFRNGMRAVAGGLVGWGWPFPLVTCFVGHQLSVPLYFGLVYSQHMFLEVLVSCLAGPDEFILWQEHQTLVMLIRAIFMDHCQFKHFAQMISLITFDLLFGYRL